MTNSGMVDTSPARRTTDAVAFPMCDGTYFVTRGSLVREHYEPMFPYTKIPVKLAEQCSVVPVMLVGRHQSLDVFEPSLLLGFNSMALVASCSCASPSSSVPLWEKRVTPCVQKFCSAPSVRVANDAVIWNQHRRHQIAGMASYSFAFDTRSASVEYNKLNCGEHIVGVSLDGKTSIVYRTGDGIDRVEGHYAISARPPNHVFFLSSGVPIFCYTNRIVCGGEQLLVGRFDAFSFSEGILCIICESAGDDVGCDKMIVMHFDPRGTGSYTESYICGSASRKIDAVSIFQNDIACVFWAESSDASTSTLSRPRKRTRSGSLVPKSIVRMYSASQLPCASTSSAGSSNHAVCEVNVGEDRVWAVQVLPRRRFLVGGNSRRVICYSMDSESPLWEVSVGDVVMSLAWVRTTNTGIAVTLKRMVSFSTTASSTESSSVPSSSVNYVGLQLDEHARFDFEIEGQCPMCNQTGSELYFPSSEPNKKNLCLVECPRILGFYTGETKSVAEMVAQNPGSVQYTSEIDRCPCGRGKSYGACCFSKLHTEPSIASVDMGDKEDHTYLCTTGYGDFFVQHLGMICQVRLTQELVRRFGGQTRGKYNPNKGALLIRTERGLGLANDAQYFAKSHQYGCLKAKHDNNVSGMTLLQPNEDNCLVPFSVVFFLWRTFDLEGARQRMQEEYGKREVGLYCEYGSQFSQ